MPTRLSRLWGILFQIGSVVREGKKEMPAPEESIEEMQDIVIFCPGSAVHDLHTLFIEMTNDHEQIDLLWSGFTQRYEIGILVLECEGALPELLQKELETNKQMTDYAIYRVPAYFPEREY